MDPRKYFMWIACMAYYLPSAVSFTLAPNDKTLFGKDEIGEKTDVEPYHINWNTLLRFWNKKRRRDSNEIIILEDDPNNSDATWGITKRPDPFEEFWTTTPKYRPFPKGHPRSWVNPNSDDPVMKIWGIGGLKFLHQMKANFKSDERGLDVKNEKQRVVRSAKETTSILENVKSWVPPIEKTKYILLHNHEPTYENSPNTGKENPKAEVNNTSGFQNSVKKFFRNLWHDIKKLYNQSWEYISDRFIKDK